MFYDSDFERKVIFEASFDKIVDEIIPKVSTAIVHNGLDPMELQNVTIPVPGLVGF